MKKLSMSIGILSWKSNEVLINTLSTYFKNGLFEIIDDVKILFQETTPEDKMIAEHFGINRIESPINLGIGKGFLALASVAKYEKFLTLEHDFALIEDQSTTYNRLREGMELLDIGFDAVKFRHRKDPGYPLFSRGAYEGRELRHYDVEIDAPFPHLLDSIFWKEKPNEDFPAHIKLKCGGADDWFVTDSRYSNFTNTPTMYKTQFYIGTVTPFAGNGIDLEGKIGKHWNRSKFQCAAGSGLFKHYDINKFGQ